MFFFWTTCVVAYNNIDQTGLRASQVVSEAGIISEKSSEIDLTIHLPAWTCFSGDDDVIIIRMERWSEFERPHTHPAEALIRRPRMDGQCCLYLPIAVTVLPREDEGQDLIQASFTTPAARSMIASRQEERPSWGSYGRNVCEGERSTQPERGEGHIISATPRTCKVFSVLGALIHMNKLGQSVAKRAPGLALALRRRLLEREERTF